MKIILCSGAGELPYSGNWGIYKGFKSLGHEVLFCGPSYNTYGRGYVAANISLSDRPHPEIYSYDEVLEKAPWKPDLMLCVEPHFVLAGNKPKGIKSFFFALDPHRGGIALRETARLGSYDQVFCSQYSFCSIFDQPTEWLPFGFDPSRLNPILDRKPVCEVVFIGQTGIANMDALYNKEDDLGKYCDKPLRFGVSKENYAFAEWGYDYAERAQHLIGHTQKFNCRIYDRVSDDKYQSVLQCGVLGFSTSLLGDFTFRILESLAVGRLIVSDYIEGQEKILPFLDSYKTYGYKPWISNFQIEVEKAAKLIQYYLDHEKERKELALYLKNEVWDNHQWRHRCEIMIEYA